MSRDHTTALQPGDRVRLSLKTNNKQKEQPFNLLIPLLAIYPKEYKLFYQNDMHVYQSTIHNTKDMEST